MSRAENRFLLKRRQDQVVLHRPEPESEVPVKLVWARPITARGGPLSLVDREKKTEVLMLESLDALDPDSRRIAQEELTARYLMPRITRVILATAHFGVHYWHVETDRGERQFALKHASKNAVWLSDDHLVLRDTLGCRYEIKPYSGLDRHSRAQVERAI